MGNPERTEDLIEVAVSDPSGAITADVSAPANFSVGEFTQAMLAELDLPTNDTAGNPIHYRPHRERDERQLLSSEQVSDVFSRDQKDHIRFDRDGVDAGAWVFGE